MKQADKIQSLQARGITKRFPGVLANDQIDFEVREGEIHALLGENGAGKSTLMKVLYGMYSPDSGSIIINGDPVRFHSPLDAISRGIVREFSIEDNVVLKDYGNPKFSNWIFIRFREIGHITRQLIERFQIKTPSTKTPAQNLYGGNIQKLILARELSRRPSVLIASQPTRGIDFNFSIFVREQIGEQRLNGATTLLISEDLDEILSLADRIAVMYEGELMGVVTRAESTIRELGMMMGGARLEQLTGES